MDWKRSLLAVCAGLIVLAPVASSMAEEKLSPQQILDKMDGLRNRFKDQEMDVVITVIDVKGGEKAYKFNLKQKGDSKRLIRFKSGEIKGMSVLTDGDRMYVYLPGYKKVRRIAAHNMNQSFVGSDFSNRDMAIVSWSKFYDATLDKEDDKEWHLKLLPKADVGAPYPKIVMRVTKKEFAQAGTDYYNDAGELVKEFRVKSVAMFHGVELGNLIEMKDPRTGHKTTLTIEEFKVDQGLKDSIFTARQLQWSR